MIFQEREVFTLFVKGTNKNWMYLEIFKGWIKPLDWKFLAQNCKVSFIVDNCSKNPHRPDLMAIDLIFLPPNSTSITHSMGSLKPKYLAKVIRKHISTIDPNKEFPKATDAMIMLEQPWSTLPDRTIVNCIKKAASSMQGDDPFYDPCETNWELLIPI